MVETQFGKVIKILRTDHRSEVVNHIVRETLEELGMLHQVSCVYTPQQNGITERIHGILLNSALALMYQSGVPMKVLAIFNTDRNLDAQSYS